MIESLSDPSTALLHLGPIGMVLLYVFYKEVLPRLADRNKDDTDEKPAGEKSVLFWQTQAATIISTTLANAITPILNQQTQILREIQMAFIGHNQSNDLILRGIQILVNQNRKANGHDVL